MPSKMDKTDIKPDDKNKPVKNKLVIKDSKQKELLRKSGLAAAIFGLGAAGAFGLSFSEISDELPVQDQPDDQDEVAIYTDAPMALHVNDEMSFGVAFAAARAEVGPGGFFVWHDRVFNTYNEEEWRALSDQDKADYWSSVALQEDAVVAGVSEGNDVSAGFAEPTDTVDQEISGGPENAPDPVSPASGIANPYDGVNEDGGSPDIQDGNQPEASAEWIPIDINGDGIIEALASDADGDGLADAVLIDTDGNAVPDVVLVNSDGMPGLDMAMIDPSGSGDFESAELVMLQEEVIIDLTGENDQSSIGAEINGGEYTDNQEPMPDIDNDADVSDFDDPSSLS